MKKIIQFQVPKVFRIFNLLPLFFLIFLSSCGGSSEHDLFAFKNSDGDWGYLNSEGDIIINNQFEEAYVFNDGLARVVIENSEGNDVYTYVNEKGEYDYNKTWDVAMDFSDGLAIVRNNLGYPKAINTDLEVVLEFPDAYSISRFSDGKAFKFIDYDDTTEATIIDKNGVSVDQAIVGYDGVKIKTHFVNGIAYVNGFEGFFLVDHDGEEVYNFGAEEQFTDIGAFNNGVAVAKFGKKGNWGLINDDGKTEVNPQFEKIYPDGKRYLVRVGKKWGWVDDDGKYIINPQFNDAGNRGFNNSDLAPVKVGKKWGYINRDGKLEINPQFDKASSFFGNIAFVYDRSIRAHGIIDYEGKYVSNPQFKEILSDYYEKRMSWESGYGSGIFSIETDYLDVESIVKSIKKNITKKGIYNVSLSEFKITNLIDSSINESLMFMKECNEEGYKINSVSNYQDYYYDYNNYKSYNEGYYKLSSISRLSTNNEDKADALTNLFKIDLSSSLDINPECEEFIVLDDITFYANVRSNRRVKKGFSQVTTKVYSSEKDNALGISSLKIGFKTFYGNILSTYRQSKRKLVAAQIRELLDPSSEIYKSISIDSGGKIILTIADPYQYFNQ